MIKMKWVVFAVAVVFVTSGVFAQGVVIDQLITARQIATANGTMIANPSRIAVTPDGKFVFSDIQDASNRRVYLADVATNPPTITFLTDTNALKAKVDAVNGDAPAPAALTIASLGVSEDGQVIIASAGGGAEAEYIFRLNPATGDLALIAGLDADPLFSSIEGMTEIAVRGRTVYVVIEANFAGESGNEDSVKTLSVDAPDGGKTPAQVLITEDAFRAVLGLIDPLAFRVFGFLPDGRFVIANSASGAASDDVLAINTETGEVSVLIRATDIEADIGAADIGQNAGAVDADGTIYMTNAFGVGATDDGVIVSRRTEDGRWRSSLLVSRTQILNSPNIFDINGMPLMSLFIVNASGASPSPGTFVFAEGNCDCFIRIREVSEGDGDDGHY